jgi:hypothetical protein
MLRVFKIDWLENVQARKKLDYGAFTSVSATELPLASST